MTISLVCPFCSAKINAPDRAAGRTGKCPKCRRSVIVPSAAAVVEHVPFSAYWSVEPREAEVSNKTTQKVSTRQPIKPPTQIEKIVVFAVILLVVATIGAVCFWDEIWRPNRATPHLSQVNVAPIQPIDSVGSKREGRRLQIALLRDQEKQIWKRFKDAYDEQQIENAKPYVEKMGTWTGLDEAQRRIRESDNRNRAITRLHNEWTAIGAEIRIWLDRLEKDD